MKNTELRIGNITCLIDRSQEVHLPIEMIPYVVSEVGMFHVNLYPLGNHIAKVEHIKADLNDVSPIKLTEEWLLKLGFKKEHNTGTADEWYWKGRGISLTHELQLGSSDRYYESMPVDGATPLKYVHQLQNLHFCLIGEELTIKQTESI